MFHYTIKIKEIPSTKCLNQNEYGVSKVPNYLAESIFIDYWCRNM